MIDPADKQTQAIPLDEQPAKRKRGRPATGKAMTPAEKQRAYRERKNRNVAENGAIVVTLTNAESTVIIDLLQTKARDIATRALHGGPVTEDKLESMNWLSDLAGRIAQARRS